MSEAEATCLNVQFTEIIFCNTSGYFCKLQPTFNISSVSVYDGKAIAGTLQVIECSNITTSILCPAGKYCPNPYEIKNCPSGHYCGNGFSEPFPCSWGNINCPVSNMSTNSIIISFFMFSLSLAILIFGFRCGIRLHIKANDGKENKNESKNSVEIFDMKALELEQQQMLHITKQVINQLMHPEQVALTDDDIIRVFQRIDEDNLGTVTIDEMSEAFGLTRTESVGLSHHLTQYLSPPLQDPHSTPFTSIYQNNSDTQSVGTSDSASSSQSFALSPHSAEITATENSAVKEELSQNEFLALWHSIKDNSEVLQRANRLSKGTQYFVQGGSAGRPAALVADTPDDGFNHIHTPLNVSFTDLNLFLNDGTTVLERVAGTVEAYNVTALMGPSGAGKTSLLNLLRGQVHYAKHTGNICINGKPVQSLAKYRDMMAFVPQDDVMVDELTVEENLMYAALLFNRRGFTKQSQCLPFISNIMVTLGIEFISQSIVGSVEKKGISGGQKKRVSVGIEMVKEAALFFLDEPTSGLDSATSMSLMNSLQNISKKGVNIVVTLHQPRQEIFQLLDRLILLAPGGKVAYFGPANKLASHFSKLHYVCPSGANVADFVMDVMAGFIQPNNSTEVPPISEIIANITSEWYQYHQYTEPKRRRRLKLDNTEAALAYYKKNNNFTSCVHTLMTSCHRELKIYERTFGSTINTARTHFLLGLVIALLFGSIALQVKANGSPAIPSIATHVTSSQLAYGLLVMTSGLKVFGHDHLVRAREESAGIVLLPLYLGKLAASTFELIFYSFAFLSGFYSIISSNATFNRYIQCFVLLQLAVMGLANLISVLFSGSMKTVVASGTLVVLWAFGGMSPTVADIRERAGPLIVLNYFSPFKWSFALHSRYEFANYSNAWTTVINLVYDNLGWQSTDISYCSGMLIMYCLMANLLSYLVLLLKRDNFRLVKDFHTLVSNIFGEFEQRQKLKSVDSQSDSVNSFNMRWLHRSTNAGALVRSDSSVCYVNDEKAADLEGNKSTDSSNFHKSLRFNDLYRSTDSSGALKSSVTTGFNNSNAINVKKYTISDKERLITTKSGISSNFVMPSTSSPS